MKSVTKVSIFFSVIGLIAAVMMHIDLYDQFVSSSGKTKALFFMREFAALDNIIWSVIGLFFAIWSAFVKEKMVYVLLSLFGALLAIAAVIVPIWRWFI